MLEEKWVLAQVEGFRGLLLEPAPGGDTALILADSYRDGQCLLLAAAISLLDGEWVWHRILELGNDTVACKLVRSVDAAYSSGGDMVAVAVVASYEAELMGSRYMVEHVLILDPGTGEEVASWSIDLPPKIRYSARASLAWMGGEALLVAAASEVVAYRAPGWSEAWRLNLKQHLETPIGSAVAVLHSCGGKVLAVLDGGGVAAIGEGGSVEWANGEADLVDPESLVWCRGGEAVIYSEPITYVIRLSDGALLSSFSAGNPGIKVEAGTYIPGKDLMLVYADKSILLYNLSGAKVYEAPNDLVLTGLEGPIILVSPGSDMVAVVGYKPGPDRPNAYIQLFKINGKGLLRIVDSMPLAPGAEKSIQTGAAWTRHGILVLLDQKIGKWGVGAKLLATTDTPVLVLTKNPKTVGKAVVTSGGGSVVIHLDRGRTSVAVPIQPGSIQVSASLEEFREGVVVMGDLEGYLRSGEAKYTTTVEKGQILHLPVAEVVKAGLGKIVYEPPSGVAVKLEFEYNTSKGPKKEIYPWYVSDRVEILVVPGGYLVTLTVKPDMSSAPILGHTPQPTTVRVSVGPGEVVELKASLGLAKLVARGTGEVIVKPLPDGEEASIRVEEESIAWLGPGDYRLTLHYWGDEPIIGPDPENYTTAEMEASLSPGQTLELSLGNVLKERLATLVLANPGEATVIATIVYTVDGEEKGIGLPLAPGEEKTVYLVPGIRYKVLAVYGEDQAPIQVAEIEAEQGRVYEAAMPQTQAPGGGEATQTQAEATTTRQTTTADTERQEDTGTTGQATQTQAEEQEPSTPGAADTGGAQEGQGALLGLVGLVVAIVIVAVLLAARRR